MNDSKQDIFLRRGKTIVAFFLTVMTPAVLCSLIGFFLPLIFTSSSEYIQKLYESIGTSLIFGLFAFIISFFHTLLLGIPLFLLGSRLNMIYWWTTLITAFIVGSMPATLIFLVAKSTSGDFVIALILGLFGLSGGITFWLLWRYWILEKPSNNFDANN